MHASALKYAELFFQTYLKEKSFLSVVDIGAQDVNGSLKDVCPGTCVYTGVDFVFGKGVDLILQDPYHLPFPDASLDIIVCSSCFEHSDFFWLLFLEIARCLKPGGFIYLNVPSNGSFHQYPVDSWRFYPDAGHSLEAWAKRMGYPIRLVESFIGEESAGDVADGGSWHDFVAVFMRTEKQEDLPQKTILSTLENFFMGYVWYEKELRQNTFLSPDHNRLVETESIIHTHKKLIADLEDALAQGQAQITEQHDDIIRQQEEINQQRLHIALQKQELLEKQHILHEIFSSHSWKITFPLRFVGKWMRVALKKYTEL